MYYINVIASILMALVGWLIAYYFTSKREFENKRREIQMSYLTDAYQKLKYTIERKTSQVGRDLLT